MSGGGFAKGVADAISDVREKLIFEAFFQRPSREATAHQHEHHQEPGRDIHGHEQDGIDR